MKRISTLVILVLLAGLMLGCSTTKPVEVISDRNPSWGVGQRDVCIYKDRLACMPMEVLTKIPKVVDKEKVIPPVDLLQTRSVEMMSDAERAKSDRNTEANVYDIKFSTKPEDYSIWNCTKTGLGSPAVDCVLMKTPDAAGKEKIASQEKALEEQKVASRILHDLTLDSLKQRCGAPMEENSNSISKSAAYKGSSRYVGFYFKEIPSIGVQQHLDSAGVTPVPPAIVFQTDAYKYVLGAQDHWEDGDDVFASYKLNPAGKVLQQMPCLKGGR